jgi:hypothetical protein
MKDSERDALFARARSAASPDETAQRRVRGAIAKRLAVGTGIAVGTTTAKAAASIAPGASAAAGAGTSATVGMSLTGLGVAKITAGVLGVVLVVATALPPKRASVVTAQSVPSPVVSTVGIGAGTSVAAFGASPVGPVAEAREILDEAPPSVPSATSAPILPAPAHASVPVLAPREPSAPQAEAITPSQATPPQPVGEVELLAAMQTALRSGDSARALSLVREHEQRFPGSPWTPEREGARVLAMCASTGPGSARALGERFLAAYPTSPLSGRVRATCGLSTAPR